MRIVSEIDFEYFEPWSGAKVTWQRISDEDKLGELEWILEDYFDSHTIDETALNDLLWFEADTVYEWLGMKTDEEIAEEKRERTRRRLAINSLLDMTDPDSFCKVWQDELDCPCRDCPLYSCDDCQDDDAMLDLQVCADIQSAVNKLLEELDDDEEE